MRVLVTCVGAYGHLHPLLPLARALAAAGHAVTVATGPDVLARAAAILPAEPAGLAVGAGWAAMAARHPDGAYDRLAPEAILDWYVPHLFAEVLAPAMLADLAPIVARWRPDVLVHDTWELAGPIAAAAAGIPSVSHTLSPRFADATVAAAAAAVAPLWESRGLAPDPTAGLYRHLCLDITPPALQPPVARTQPRPVVRPLRPVPPAPAGGEALPAWIAGRRSVPLVYMTLGTNTNTDLAMFRSVIAGLGDQDLDVQITVGPDGDPAALGPVPANVHVARYVPQALLLPHCAAVICHSGAGTVFNALALGLPLLLLPQGADQYVIAERAAAAGAGQVLHPADVSPEAVRAGVRALLTTSGYRAGARRVQAAIAAMPGPEAAVAAIAALVATRSGTPDAGTFAKV